jgi:hypothetical protein
VGSGDEEDESEDEEGDQSSGLYQLGRSRCSAYPFRAANASVTALGAGG